MTKAEMRAAFTRALAGYESVYGEMAGIAAPAARATLIEQLIESARRNEYFTALRRRPIGSGCADPHSNGFDPLRAAVFFDREGQRDEAYWMVFLFVHFGKSRTSGWHLPADVYGRLGTDPLWSFAQVAGGTGGFRTWLHENVDTIHALTPRRTFGNHRKYQSLAAWNDKGTSTGDAVATYVSWVGEGHDDKIAGLLDAAGSTSTERFDAVFDSLRAEVATFGRTAAFDYCSKVGKLQLAPIAPGRAGLDGATGPLRGARLLVDTDATLSSPRDLELVLAPLQAMLGIGFDALEDALCNWQKSPELFKRFRA